MEKLLIIGGTGLIGYHLTEELKKEKNKYKLYITTRDIIKYDNSINYIYLDLCKDFDTKKLPQKIDGVIYLAQSRLFREFPEKALNIFKVNVYALEKILDYSIKTGIKKFIYASSGGVYGNLEKHFSEDMPIHVGNNLGFYLGTKLCGEILTDNYSSLLDIVTLRFFFVYGPFQNKNMLIPRLVDNIINSKPIILQGTKGIKINPIYVTDAVNAIEKCFLLKGSHKINIAGPDILSLSQIAKIIGNKVKKSPKFVLRNERANDIIGDIKKMSSILYKPEIAFEAGIEKYLQILEEQKKHK